MLNEDRDATRRARDKHDWSELAPADPAEALDAHHFAERFGLFLIILLGEVVVEAGQSAAAQHVGTTGGWTALVAAMILAAALWWLYFDSVAEVNLRVLELSGGSPTMARAIFAVGHMVPAFALLITASGVGLLLEDDPPRIAYNLACFGVAIYMLGTRVIRMGSARVPAPVRVLLVVATFLLGRLFHGLGGYGYLWLLTAWVLMSPRSPRARAPATTTRSHASSERAVAHARVPGVGLEPTRPLGQPGLSRPRIDQFRHPGPRLLV